MAELDIYKVNLDTPQPDGRRGESPRAAFTKYNDLIDALMRSVDRVGATEPNPTEPYMLWIDTSVDPAVVKRRNADDDAWITIGPALEAFGPAAYADIKQATGASENDVMSQKATSDALGEKNNQGTGNAQTRTNTQNDGRFARLAGGADADFATMPMVGGKSIVGQVGLGVGQTWQDVTSERSDLTTFTNTTGRAIEVNVVCRTETSQEGNVRIYLIVDGNKEISQVSSGIIGDVYNYQTVSATIPDGSEYETRVTYGEIHGWWELRA